MNLAPTPSDPFYWLGEINKACAVMLVERGIVPAALGADIADATTRVLAAGQAPDAARPADYLAFEAELIAAGGPEVSRVHSGRSRQDIGATFGRVFLRDGLLGAIEALNQSRFALLTLAESAPHAVIPAYTWGVQAQPTTLGHWLGAYAAAFGRTAERLRSAYRRVNLCPLGCAALGTSSFPVDRPRLAELLGFDGPAENSFDATQLAPADLRAEALYAASTGALTVGTLAADFTHQYAQVRPWFTLDPGAQTGVSSIMPQKRNPTGLVWLRARASRLVGASTLFAFEAHNVPSGMHDYKLGEPDQTLGETAQMFDELTSVLNHLRFDPARALDEVNAEYSTTTELADVLQREADVPFRAGHHFASALVTFGRSERLRPGEIPFAQAQRIWADAAGEFGLDVTLPLDEATFRHSLSPDGMVRASQGLGGPQPAEVERMLGQAHQAASDDTAWASDARAHLEGSRQALDAAFSALSGAP